MTDEPEVGDEQDRPSVIFGQPATRSGGSTPGQRWTAAAALLLASAVLALDGRGAVLVRPLRSAARVTTTVSAPPARADASAPTVADATDPGLLVGPADVGVAPTGDGSVAVEPGSVAGDPTAGSGSGGDTAPCGGATPTSSPVPAALAPVVAPVLPTTTTTAPPGSCSQ